MFTTLKNHKVLAKIIGNSSWLILDKVTRLILGLTVTAWIARFLGPESYGSLAYVLAIVALCQAITKLGLDSIIVRDMSISDSSPESLLGTTLRMRIASGVIVYFSVVAFSFIFNDINTAILFSLAGGSIIFQSADTIDLWFQSKSKSKFTVKAKLFSYAISAIIKILLILQSASITWFALVFAIESMLTAFGLLIVYRKFPTKKRWMFDKTMVLRNLKEAFPYLMTSISMLIYIRIDQVMIKHFLDVEELGIFSAVIPFSTLWNVLPMVFGLSIAPHLSRIRKENKELYNLSIRVMFSFFAIIGVVIICVMTLLSAPLVTLILGQQYLDGISILEVHVLSNVFICLGVAQGLWIVNEGRGFIALYRTLLGAIVSLIGNYYFLPIFGLIGAAYVAVSAQFVQAVLSNIIFDRKIFFLQLRCLVLIEPYILIKSRVWNLCK
ncbi:flippase [Vibrio splendidus]